jgi:hypothetical protein
LHRRIDVTRAHAGLDPAFHPFNQALLFRMDKNSDQCEKRVRQQIAYMTAM